MWLKCVVLHFNVLWTVRPIFNQTFSEITLCKPNYSWFLTNSKFEKFNPELAQVSFLSVPVTMRILKIPVVPGKPWKVVTIFSSLGEILEIEDNFLYNEILTSSKCVILICKIQWKDSVLPNQDLNSPIQTQLFAVTCLLLFIQDWYYWRPESKKDMYLKNAFKNLEKLCSFFWLRCGSNVSFLLQNLSV